MPYNNPPIMVSPLGVDAPIKEIQEQMALISYVEQSWGRAFKLKEEIGGRVLTIPKAYYANNEYAQLLPDPDLTARTFMVVTSEERNDNYDATIVGQRWERDLSLIFYGNLKLIDSEKDYIFTEEIREDLERALFFCPSVLSVNDVYDEDYDDIWAEFDLPEEIDAQWLMYPFVGIRIDVTVAYEKPCRTEQNGFLLTTDEDYLFIDTNAKLIL